MGTGLAEQVDNGSQEAQKTEERLQVVTLRLPGELITVLDRIVEERGFSSRSELVRQLLGFSLSGKTFNAERAQQAAEKFLSPILPKVGNLLKEIAAALPKDKLLELGVVALIPFAQFISAIAEVSTEEVAQGLSEMFAEIIGEPEES